MPSLLAQGTVVAFVALGGTLIGGLIGAVTQILVSRSAAKTQATIVSLQAENLEAVHWRDERQSIYTAFAHQAYVAQIQIEAFCDSQLHPRKPTEAEMTQLLWDLEQAWARLSILAGPALTKVSRDITSHLWDCYTVSPQHDDIYRIRPAEISDETLVAAIKAELGIDAAGGISGVDREETAGGSPLPPAVKAAR